MFSSVVPSDIVGKFHITVGVTHDEYHLAKYIDVVMHSGNSFLDKVIMYAVLCSMQSITLLSSLHYAEGGT